MSSSGSRRRRTVCRDVPADVVEEILVRLPVKHIIRCKLLSKTYYALINAPGFVNKHLSRNNLSSTNHNALICMAKYYLPNGLYWGRKLISLLPALSDIYKPFSGVDIDDDIYLLAGSCNGLLCALFKYGLVLWNPATREHKTIHKPELRGKKLAIGFGYDAASDDYKVVVMCRSSSNPFVTEVWSMKANCWTEIKFPKEFCLKGLSFYHFAGALVREKLYWFVGSPSHGTFVASFDLVNNSFCSNLINVPVAIASSEDRFRRPFEGMGSLIVSILRSVNNSRDSNFMYDLWAMSEDDNFLWTKQHSFECWQLLQFRASVDGKFLAIAPCNYDGCKLLLYSPHSKQPEEVEGNMQRGFIPSIWIFAESLVSLQKN